MKEKTKKVVCTILLLMITLSSFSQVFAVEIGSTQDIVNMGVCPANIWYRKDGVSIGVLTHMVGFYEDDRDFYVACTDQDYHRYMRKLPWRYRCLCLKTLLKRIYNRVKRILKKAE